MNERLYDNGYGAPYPGGDPAPAVQHGKTRDKRPGGPAWTMILGGTAAVIGFLLLYTPALLAYKVGTLSDAHAFCTSGLGVLARGFNATANSECSSIGNWYAFGNFLLWGGLAVVAGGAAWWFTRSRNQKGA